MQVPQYMMTAEVTTQYFSQQYPREIRNAELKVENFQQLYSKHFVIPLTWYRCTTPLKLMRDHRRDCLTSEN